MGAGGDLNQLSKSVSDLCLRKCSEESEIKEGLHWSVIGTESVLVVAIVDADLDADTGVNQADDGSGNADVVGSTSVCSACEPDSLS